MLGLEVATCSKPQAELLIDGRCFSLENEGGLVEVERVGAVELVGDGDGWVVVIGGI